MAFYEDDEDEVLDPDAPKEEIGGKSGLIAGAGSGASEGAGTPAAGGGAPTSQFVGIQEYLQANKPQSEKLAQNVGGYVNQLGDEARSTLSGQEQKFNQAVDENTVQLNQDLFNQAKTDATKVASQEQDLSNFQKMRDASYKGPQNLEGTDYFQPIKSSVEKAQKAAQNTQTEQGQRELLAGLQQRQRGKVNPGALTFDAALLGSDPKARDILSQSREAQSGLKGLLDTTKANAGQKIANAKATTQATRDAIQNTFGGENSVQNQLMNALNQRTTEQRGLADQQARATIDALKGNKNLTDDQLGLLDISRDQYNQILNERNTLNSTWGGDNYSDLSGYSTLLNPEVGINAQNVANADDYARYAALNQLMGTDNRFLSDPSLAGTADLDALDFNYGGALGDIQGAIGIKRAQDAEREAQRLRDAERIPEESPLPSPSIREPGSSPKAPGSDGGGILKVIGGIFCFIKGTPILMEDGSFKKVEDLRLLDEVSRGGKVLGFGTVFCDEIVLYKGILTSSNHAIRHEEDLKWYRAKNLPGSQIFNLKEPVIVYPVVTEHHRLLTDNGVLYSDMVEVDQTEGLSDEEKLRLLNEGK